ncbi:chlorovirus glycoprotein repeat domain-containing protein [Striga asiatica]|uniref:Chlorovirus glycoprotein repeat domain-containing protein n=1 Tax=Striga asiatica TaxID=4170 RepID=A0A5A7RC13_STRAF|nr:chlorovirus glycoprotein repeat domain-containing protein [Striga asiatica]
MGGARAEVSFDPKICSRMAWNEWPGSGSTKWDWSRKKIRDDFGSEVLIGLDSDPSTPLISGLKFFIQPSMWSNDRFSITRTTTVFIGPVPAPVQCRWPARRRRRRNTVAEDVFAIYYVVLFKGMSTMECVIVYKLSGGDSIHVWSPF